MKNIVGISEIVLWTADTERSLKFYRDLLGLEVISPPIAFELPVNTLNTPAGIPARSAKAANAKAENGVALAGFATMVQPEANAGPAFRVIMAAGKFQGVMAAQTPIGCLTTTSRRSFQGDGIVSP